MKECYQFLIYIFKFGFLLLLILLKTKLSIDDSSGPLFQNQTRLFDEQYGSLTVNFINKKKQNFFFFKFSLNKFNQICYYI